MSTRPVRRQNHNEATSDFKMEEIVQTLFENGRVAVSEGGRGVRPAVRVLTRLVSGEHYSRDFSAAQHLGGRDFHATVDRLSCASFIHTA